MRRRDSWVALGLAAFVACASTAPAERSAAESSPRPRLAREDLLEVALIASGYDDPTERAAAKAELNKRIAPIVTELSALPSLRDRAARLLTRLHGPGALLGSYEARATTLREILEKGSFNCVSASLLYGVVGAQLGLEISGQLLPTHARSLAFLEQGGKKLGVIVETTSPGGFDPSPEAMAAILKDVALPVGAGDRTLVSEKGLIVPTLVLAAATYVNRGSLLQEQGDLKRAEAMFARAELLADDATMRGVLRDQRAALLTQLAVDDLLTSDPARVPRAYRSMVAAVKVAPQDPETRQTVAQNLRAAAERLIAAAADQQDEPAVNALVKDVESLPLDPPVRASISAFAWSEIARVRGKAGDYDGSLAAIERGLLVCATSADESVKGTLEKNRIAALRMAALTTAKSGDTDKSLDYVRKLEATPGLSVAERSEAARDQLRVLVLAAQGRYEKKDVRGALELYRQAHAKAPADKEVAHNLLAVLEEVVVPEINANRCGTVERELAEIRKLAPSEELPDRAEARCLVGRAAELLEASDEAGAVELLRKAARLRPKDGPIRQNLVVGLTKQAKAEARAGHCAKARSVATEVLSVDKSLGRALVAEVARCAKAPGSP